jgi:hypothetical protein
VYHGATGERKREREICENYTKTLITKCSISVVKQVGNIEGGQAAGPLKMEPICFPETSVTLYQCMLCNIPEEKIFYLHGGGSMKSRRAVNIITTALRR